MALRVECDSRTANLKAHIIAYVKKSVHLEVTPPLQNGGQCHRVENSLIDGYFNSGKKYDMQPELNVLGLN